jgi:hypothetical protein
MFESVGSGLGLFWERLEWLSGLGIFYGWGGIV